MSLQFASKLHAEFQPKLRLMLTHPDLSSTYLAADWHPHSCQIKAIRRHTERFDRRHRHHIL